MDEIDRWIRDYALGFVDTDGEEIYDEMDEEEAVVYRRTKTHSISQKDACFLMRMLIENFEKYNEKVARGSRDGNGSVKRQFWEKWSKELEVVGEKRSWIQVKKKINGELWLVRKRISDENEDASKVGGAGTRRIFPTLSPSRQMLYDFLRSKNDRDESLKENEAGEPPVKRCKSAEEKKAEPIVKNEPIEDEMELQREVLLAALENAEINRELLVQKRQNLEMESRMLDMQLQNAKIRKNLLEKQRQQLEKQSRNIDVLLQNAKLERDQIESEQKGGKI